MSKIDELDWKDDEIEFWFESNEVYDSKEKRMNLKRIEKSNSLGLGSDNRNIESKLRKHKKGLGWKEPERRGSKFKNMKYKKMDLLNGYEDEERWRIRMKVNSKGKLWFWIEF